MVKCMYKDVNGCRCTRDAYYGEISGNPIFCVSHNEKKMDNVVAPRCQYDGCRKCASWGPLGTRKRLYCAPHGREMGMETKHSKCKCGGSIPSFAKPGEKAVCCKQCREDGMENVKSKKCEVDECITQPSYGFGLGNPIRCKAHALDGMDDVISKKCEVESCTTWPSFGFETGKSVRCKMHALDGMSNVVAKFCMQCKLFQVWQEPYLCSYCNPNSSSYQKTREDIVKKLLESSQDTNNFIHDKPITGGCFKYRPDFLYDAATHYVIVEVDEDQHNGYNPECEKIRMINIVGALGMRCIFIRYNPDAFYIDDIKIKISEKKRHDLLLKMIHKYMKPSVDSRTMTTGVFGVDVVYLYYDGAEIRFEML
jgi:hypothetical protein